MLLLVCRHQSSPLASSPIITRSLTYLHLSVNPHKRCIADWLRGTNLVANYYTFGFRPRRLPIYLVGLVGRERFELPKPEATRLQRACFNHLHTYPIKLLIRRVHSKSYHSGRALTQVIILQLPNTTPEGVTLCLCTLFNGPSLLTLGPIWAEH